MAKEKVVNYTDEQVARLREVYLAASREENEAGQKERDAAVATLAKEFGKHPASIRSKLSRETFEDGESIYMAKVTLTKNGEKPESKESIVNTIADLLDVPAESFDSLAKATKPVLVKIRAALTERNKEASE